MRCGRRCWRWLLWIAVAFAVWADGVALMARIVPQLPWTGWEWVAQWAAAFLLLAAFVALTYITASCWSRCSPCRADQSGGGRDYPDLGRHGENVFWGSLATPSAPARSSSSAAGDAAPAADPGACWFAAALGAWLNQRTFRFDALAEHATRTECNAWRAEPQPLSVGRAGTAAVAYVPLVNLLAPAFTALVFVHLGLAALRRRRQEGGGSPVNS
jgi:CysZ protein